MNQLPDRLAATAAGAALLLLLAACAGTRGEGSTGAAASPAPSASADADSVVIRVDEIGGFVPVNYIPSRLPEVVVYGDGRVITEGPVPLIYPGPALPNVQQQRVPDVAALVKQALDAGVGSAVDYGRPGVTDVPDTRFRVVTAEGVKETTVYALEMSADGPGLTDAQRAARAKLTKLLEDLRNPPTATGEPESYPVTVIAAISVPHSDQRPPEEPSPPPAVAWPGPALPGEKIGPAAMVDVGCVSASGDQAKAVVEAATNANAATPWTSGGRTWSVVFRPLLPDEKGCADLAKQS